MLSISFSEKNESKNLDMILILFAISNKRALVGAYNEENDPTTAIVDLLAESAPPMRHDAGGVSQIRQGRLLPLFRGSRRSARQAELLWYGEPDATANAISYAKFYSRSHDAVIRICDEAGNVIETHEQAGEFREL